MSYETRLLILNREAEVLTQRTESGFRLPGISAESGRVGISVTRAVRAQLNLEVFLLVLATIRDDGAMPVLRLQSENCPLPKGLVWIKPSEISDPIPEEQHIFHTFSGDDAGIGRYEWYTLVQTWLVREVSNLGFTIKSLEQWNGRPGGVLLQVNTDGPIFWFKAVTDFNAREIGIAQLLAARHPAHFPKVLATAPEWNAFLLEHVDGEELYAIDDLPTWQRAARLLASVQIDWLGHEEKLLRAGAADLRPLAIRNKLPQFLAHVAAAMQRQPKTPPARLDVHDLNELRQRLEFFCMEVNTLPFACGLANADFSPHNTLITASGPRFIDWAEACVSLPLIAGEYMWRRMALETPARAAWVDPIRAAYLARWSETFGAAAVERSARLLPAFALLAVAVFYHEREDPNGSRFDGYIRSLTRKVLYSVRELSEEPAAVSA